MARSAPGQALRTWAIVVGAGAGERLGIDRPKAFAPFAGRTLLAASLAILEEHDGVDGIVVAVPEGWEERTSLIADDIGAGKIAVAVAGGVSRAESVACALAEIPDGVDFVLVHDAARPLLEEDLIDRVLGALAEGCDGVVPALEVVDTVKRLGVDGVVAETIPRAGLRTVQTPQGFPVAVLRAAIATSGERLAQATDCAALVEWAGGRVVTVRGDAGNLKVTTPADLAIAERVYVARHGGAELDLTDDEDE